MAGRGLAVAVIGPGRAGRARVRALDEHPRAHLHALVTRDPAPGEPTLEGVLAQPGTSAVIVCSPNLLHARVVRAALEAGKHVAVEFPLAASAAEARDLLGLARRVGRVLHVEHIELLSSSQRALREWARDLGRPRAGGVRFTGALEGWLSDPASAGSPALCAVARLHRLVDLFGPARVGAARVEPLSGGWRLEVELGFERGGVASLVEERARDLDRTSTWRVDCERGVLETPPAAPAGALFREDLDCFIARVETGAASYVSDERVLHVLGLVDAIDALLA